MDDDFEGALEDVAPDQQQSGEQPYQVAREAERLGLAAAGRPTQQRHWNPIARAAHVC